MAEVLWGCLISLLLTALLACVFYQIGFAHIVQALPLMSAWLVPALALVLCLL